jgi:SAM-dependent methyltransferase
MNENDKDIITTRYRERLRQHGPGISALASGTTERRAIRFGVLGSIGNLEGASILDLGCGLADFYAYLKECGMTVRYTGYDITPEFVGLSKERFPEARFEVRDVQVDGIPDRFDYIISSQTFNNRLAHGDNRQLMQDVLRVCYEASNIGVAIDMLTSYVDYGEEHLFYYQPEEVFRWAKALTKRVVLRHEHPLYEFAVFMYKDFTGWRT